MLDGKARPCKPMRRTRTSEWLDAVRSSAFRASQAMIDQLIAQNMWAASGQLSCLGGERYPGAGTDSPRVI
jgi:hypothetical protein